MRRDIAVLVSKKVQGIPSHEPIETICFVQANRRERGKAREKAKARGQKAEVRSQRSEVRGQKSEVRGQGEGVPSGCPVGARGGAALTPGGEVPGVALR
jgi:hypothetical protein